MIDPQKLDEMFDELNKDFWGGRLPKYQVRRGVPPTRSANTAGYCDTPARTIWIQTSPNDLRKTMLHEMCHIGCPSHGKMFQDRLQRLANLGESWAVQELADYAENTTYNQELANIRTRICDLAWERNDLHADDVLASFADDLGLSVTEMQRRAPWIKPAWEKEKRAAAPVLQRLSKR